MKREPTYLIRYGLRGHVGEFPLVSTAGFPLERGQIVVVHTDRGEEAGEVLVSLNASSLSRIPSSPSEEGAGGSSAAWQEESPKLQWVRPVTDADVTKMSWCEKLRGERFSICQRVLEESRWPLELIDVEPLLDENTTVIHFLGPPDLDLGLLRARLRSSCDFEVVLEPLSSGQGTNLDHSAPSPAEERAGGCGDCGCTNEGCGQPHAATAANTQSEEAHEAYRTAKSCSSAVHSACSSCGISKMLRRKPPPHF
jgi:hypothetical protein